MAGALVGSAGCLGERSEAQTLPGGDSGVAFNEPRAIQPWLQVWPTAPVCRIRPRSICPPISHPNTTAHCGQRAAVAEVLLCFSLPGAQPAERDLHLPLQRPDEDCAGEQQETDEDECANGPAPAVLPHERPNAERGQGTAVKAQQRCREESPRHVGQGTSQLPKGGIAPGIKPRGGGHQVSFPRPWCLLPASAALQASREALLAEAELLSWNQLKHLVRTQQTWRIGKCLVRTTLRAQAG